MPISVRFLLGRRFQINNAYFPTEGVEAGPGDVAALEELLGHLERRNVANCLCSSFAFPNRICQLTTNSIYVEIYPVPVAVVQVGVACAPIGVDGIGLHHLSGFQQADP